MTRLRRTTRAVVAIAALGVLGACTSQPSAQTVARDAVESLPDLSATERTCMLEVIDAMGKDELEQLGKNNVGVAITDAESGDADMQAFIESLADCRAAG